MNYQKELDILIEHLQMEEKSPKLLLHSCCAPCSSYVLEYLSQYFQITVLYYNPNIFPEEEYATRVLEQQTLIAGMHTKYPISFLGGPYDKEKFYEAAGEAGCEKEGGERCFRCYALRLSEAARIARDGAFDYFATTLSISPLKNAEKLNEIGKLMEKKYGVCYLPSDFKKKNGYRRSVELSKKFGLYRQNYCGCEFSYREMENRLKNFTSNSSHDKLGAMYLAKDEK